MGAPPTRRTSPWVLAPSVLALTYAIAVVVAAWRAPDKGFQAFTGHRVVEVEAGGVAERAGLRVGDVIVAVDGVPVTSTFDYAFRVIDRAPGELVALGVDRDGAHRDVSFALGASSPPWAALAATVLAAVLLVLGLIARIGRPEDPDARRFYRTSIAYTLTYVGALSWARLIVHPVLGALFLAGLFSAPAVSVDLAIDFPHRATGSPAARRWRLVSYATCIALSIACAVAGVVAGLDYRDDAGDRALTWVVALVAMQLAFVVVHANAGLWFQVRALRTLTGPARAQLRWIVFGQFACMLPAVGAVPFALADLELFILVWYKPFVVAVAALWFVAYGLAVLRVRLADVDALIRTSLGYAAATGGAVVVYVGIVLAAGWATGRLVGEAGPWPHLAAGLAAAAMFGPIRIRIDAWVDRRFFRDRRHYVEALRRASESIAHLREPDALAREAVERVVDAVRAENGALYVQRDAGWTIAHAVGGDFPAQPDAPESGLAMRVSGERTGELAAMLVLGPRLSGDMYSTEDRDLLAALASQLAVALANARAFGTIALMKRELEEQNDAIRARNDEIQVLRERLEDENRFLRGRVAAATDGAALIGDSRAIVELVRTIERVARSDASVLVLGESGTGKGLVARTLHAASARAGGPFLHVDCGAIAAGVFESELFGHERGAFTGAARMRRGPIELADGGTLFLDEIGELPLALQPKLLRVLQDKTIVRVGGTQPVAVDVRIVAATHRDLDAMVARGELREDLMFRLRVVELVVPPLRARRGDLPALCASLLPRVARRCGRRPRPVAEDALARMAGYGWPGNVRELENVLERALVLGEGEQITAAELDLPDRPAPLEAPHGEVMEGIEKERLLSALRAAGGNQSHAAKALGMPRTTLINKLRRHGLL
ncbi:MAG: sigma 54-interacting transcriptional regulator [Deltaproteobacteria bacterium]|nr:sigma 54-interacting transcriptional regulator [Deltaproteobacteria bacterium]